MTSLIIRSAAIALAFAALAAAPGSGVFDKPIDTKVISLPADPANPQAKPKRTCTVYRDFIVKEVDLGEKGAAELAIAPNKPSNATCPQKLAGEMVVKSKDWGGYVLGAKGPFVFFNADDGLNGGLPFAVYSATTGKKLFEESRQGEDFKFVAVVNGALVMRYRRVWLAPCSLMSDAKGCWAKIMAHTALPEAARPDCSAKYREAMKAWPKDAETTEKSPTVISYDVEARYAGGKPDFKPLAGRAACWLED